MREYHGFSCMLPNPLFLGIERAHVLTRIVSSPQGGNNYIMPFGTEINPLYAGIAATLLGGIAISGLAASRGTRHDNDSPGVFRSFVLFFYSCFIKPHQGDSKASQQDALESFYKKQAGAYDATRKLLLRGREDMLALVAAQLEAKAKMSDDNKSKRIWVDVSFLIAYLEGKRHLKLTDKQTGWRRHWLEH